MISKINSTQNNTSFGSTLMSANKYFEVASKLPQQLADEFYCKTSMIKGPFSPRTVIEEMRNLRRESAAWPSHWNKPGDNQTILNIIESGNNTHVIAETREADLKVFGILKKLFGDVKYFDDFRR